MKNMLALICVVFAFNNLTAQNEKTLPNINLKDVLGKSVNVKNYEKSGKIVIISFWATWCTPCKKELNNINELYEDWKEKYDIKVVAVSTDNARNVMKVKLSDNYAISRLFFIHA
jgi:thiol-disulfide isomerase/thioredoxin